MNDVTCTPLQYTPSADTELCFEHSDFKIGRQMGFAKAHHIIPPRRKTGRGPGLGELPKISGFPINIYAMAKSIDFKFGTQNYDPQDRASIAVSHGKNHATMTPRNKHRKCIRN